MDGRPHRKSSSLSGCFPIGLLELPGYLSSGVQSRPPLDKESINPSCRTRPSFGTFLILMVFHAFRWGCTGFPKGPNSVGASRSSFLMRVRVKLERGRRFCLDFLVGCYRFRGCIAHLARPLPIQTHFRCENCRSFENVPNGVRALKHRKT